MNIDFENIDAIFLRAERENRSILFEHEVYQLLQEAGIRTPKFHFVRKGNKVSEKNLSHFPSYQLVLKIVSPLIVHKSDVGGVRFVNKSVEEVNRSIEEMLASVPRKYLTWIKKSGSKRTEETEILSSHKVEEQIEGVLLCESVDYDSSGFGTELLLGLRVSREFGPVVTMGIGGLDVEYLTEKIKQRQALSIGSAHLTREKEILSLLKPLAFFNKLTLPFRGREILVPQEELAEIYARFIRIGEYYSPYGTSSPYVIEEAEANPLVFNKKKLIPLDGLCRFSRNHQKIQKRPLSQVKSLLEPRNIGIIGVSEKMNIGRIILKNILKNGFSPKNIYVVKPKASQIDGCLCVSSISELSETVDLFVLTVSAEKSEEVLKEIVSHEKARSVIIISGGIGEKEGTERLEQSIRALLLRSRQENKLTPLVNGGNCLGIYSRPGKYDTTFVPDYKLYRLPRPEPRKANLVYLSQSGAFMISRMSKLPSISPLYAVSIGNQIDLTVSDYLNYLKDNREARIFAVYLEGFQPGDGLTFARAAREITGQKGKAVLVYKAGRTPEGQTATASHTASVAGNHAVNVAVLKQSGVIVAESIFEFESAIKGFCFLSEKKVFGNRVGLISNAGFESVIMSDSLKNNEELELARLSRETRQRITEILKPLGIDLLQDVRNPLDLTPVADDRTFCKVAEAVLEDDNVDCAIISPVPMTPAMQTLAPAEYHGENILRPGSTPLRLIDLFRRTKKPFVVSVDSGEIYDPMFELLESEGVPTFRRCDDAVGFLRKYIHCTQKKSL